jgi:hypothetical protein
MICKEFARKRSWRNRCIIPAFSWRHRRKHEKPHPEYPISEMNASRIRDRSSDSTTKHSVPGIRECHGHTCPWVYMCVPSYFIIRRPLLCSSAWNGGLLYVRMLYFPNISTDLTNMESREPVTQEE